jgi:hypothetical protein
MKKMRNYAIFIAMLLLVSNLSAQTTFEYRVELSPVVVSGLGGLHSYAFAQHDGKWLLIGGRKDGLHARQPFNAFPESANNTDIIVVDVAAGQYWAQSLAALPVGIREQLQSTNMNFHQVADTLYIIGGYAYSATAADHITFPNLTTINVSGLMSAVMTGSAISSYFKQITDNNFAITGGQLGRLADTFYLIGGHRFDGRYNPMGNPTYTQTYSNQIRKFSIDNSNTNLSYSNYSTITDQVHLHRRDYNLLPQVFPNGELGYTISAGVFQIGVDLPYLYPVDVQASGITAQTNFNQYLSHYHSPKACLFDSSRNQMHSLFFGGLSQYYYDNGNIVQDDLVPFVKTISRMSRMPDGTLQEAVFDTEMPNFKGAGAEFIPNLQLPHFSNEVIKIAQIQADTILIGHIYGGILSPSRNPFSNNQTSTTTADTSIYSVRLIRQLTSHSTAINGQHNYSIRISPNPIINNDIIVSYNLPKAAPIYYLISDAAGKICLRGEIAAPQVGEQQERIALPNTAKGNLFVTFVFEGKYFTCQPITVP